MSIFIDNCDRYWDAGLPVVPLVYHDKRPAVGGWQTYANQMPTEHDKELWKREFPSGNVGLPLGPQSGLIVIDIDTDDPRILGVLDKVLPPSPWRRVGQKGYVSIYRYDGQPTIRIDHRENGELKRVVEMLSAGTQVVLPPSIHPKTGKPYIANADIVSVLDKVRSLPVNMEALLRDALKEVGIEVASSKLGSLTNFVSPGARDNTMTSIAGLYAFDITRGYKTLLEACQQIETWVEEFTGKVYNDNLDKTKASKKVVEMLIKDVTGPKRKTLPKGWDDGLSDDDKNGMGLDIFTKDHETWSGDQIRQYFDAQLSRDGLKENREQFLDLVRNVVYKVAANRGLDPLEENVLLRYISQVSDKEIQLTELRKMVTDYRAGEIRGTDHSEIAKAILDDLVERKGELRYYNNAMWYYGGSHWMVMEDQEILKYIAEEYGSFSAASKANDHRGILAVMRNMAAKELKTDEGGHGGERGINFVNGFLNEDLELVDHNPDHGMTYCLEYPYVAEEAGKCTKWLAMLHQYWGQDPDYADKVNALGEAMAITMFGKATELQKAFCLYGVAHSGKSRILEIVQALMPKEAQTSIPPTLWGDKFGSAPLADKLLNYAGELSEHAMINSEKFKQIVEGAQIDGQFKNQQIFTFRPKAAHWFASNHLPRSRDSSEGFTRRWLFLSFPRKFTGIKILDYHKEVVAEERVAIAAWAVQYIARLRSNNWMLTIPKSSEALCIHLENELNSVRSFLADLQEQGRLLLGVSETITATTFDTLWNEYRSYCVAASVSPVGSRVLIKRMDNLQGVFGFQTEKEKNNQGFLVVQYRYLTFADKRGRSG